VGLLVDTKVMVLSECRFVVCLLVCSALGGLFLFGGGFVCALQGENLRVNSISGQGSARRRSRILSGPHTFETPLVDGDQYLGFSLLGGRIT